MAVSPDKPYDLIIVGAGPAGSTATLYAARRGLRTLLVDKDKFPREKVCGDALSGKSVAVLRDLNLLDRVQDLPGASVHKVVFGSPNGTTATIRLPQNGSEPLSELDRYEDDSIPVGFVIRREIFDYFLFREAQKAADTCLEQFTVRELVMENGQICGVRGTQAGGSELMDFKGHIVLGADGFNSIVARKTGVYQHEPRHWIVALRGYYRNVRDLTDQIELHYVDEVIPGYFWIFPLEDGLANVGVGMVCEYLKERKVNLRQALKNAVESPQFQHRFADSEAVTEPVGWNLPVGSKHRTIVGNGFMLLGDAAGLIDPFTGEGIGNAMFSARVAVDTAVQACQKGDFREKSLLSYDVNLWGKIGPELRISTKLQQLGQRQFLLNFVIGKASRSKEVRDVIGGMIVHQVPRKKLTSPLFYLKLLFA